MCVCVREIEGLDTPDAQKTLNTHFLLIFDEAKNVHQ